MLLLLLFMLLTSLSLSSSSQFFCRPHRLALCLSCIHSRFRTHGHLTFQALLSRPTHPYPKHCSPTCRSATFPSGLSRLRSPPPLSSSVVSPSSCPARRCLLSDTIYRWCSPSVPPRRGDPSQQGSVRRSITASSPFILLLLFSSVPLSLPWQSVLLQGLQPPHLLRPLPPPDLLPILQHLLPPRRQRTTPIDRADLLRLLPPHPRRISLFHLCTPP